MTYTITSNNTFNSLEVTFNEKPSAQIRNILKSLKFRWNPKKSVWYGYSTKETLQKALEASEPEQLANQKINTEVNYTDGYLGAVEMTGCNYSLNNDITDINKIVKKQMKKAFPMFKTKTSSKKYSGGQSITFTLLVDQSYLKSDDELVEVLADHYFRYPGSWNLGRNINRYSDFEEVKAAVILNLDRLKEAAFNEYNTFEYFFNDQAIEALNYAKQLYKSFNHDDSNIMVDYFDRYFYDNYKIVAVKA